MCLYIMSDSVVSSSWCVLSDCQGCFPPPCGPESLSTLLDEESVVRLCHSPVNGPSDDNLQFQYYVIDGTTIIGLLEKSLTSGSGERQAMLFVYN